jgi:hypothetical protein
MKKNVRKNAGMLLLMMSLCGAGTVLAQDPHLLVCEGRGYTLTNATGATDGATYKWYENDKGGGFTEVGDQTNPMLTIAPGKTTGKYQYVRMASIVGCTDVPSNTYTVEVVATPTVPSIDQSTLVKCDVGDVVFSIAEAANTTYTWASTGIGTGVVSGTGNTSYTVTAAGFGKIEVSATVSVTHNSGTLTPKVCVSSTPATADADVNPIPTLTNVTSTTAVCGTGDRDLIVTVTANGSDVTTGPNTTITWYSDENGNTSVNGEGGANYFLEDVTVTTPYWVGAVVNSCPASNNFLKVDATVSLNEGAIGGQEN